jgi:hypothetical protein
VTTWGVVATVLAPEAQVLAFARHHLALGAARVWLHFDDPGDAAAEAAAALPGVRAIRCDAAHWQALAGGRPDKHQARQSRNARRIYNRCRVGWLAHLDVDEFLLPASPVTETLAAAPPDAPLLRAAPWEALHDPAVTAGPFPARHFRAVLKGDRYGPLRAALFGRYAPLLPEGTLSHSAGKCFFRTGIPGLVPRIHSAFLNGERLHGAAADSGIPLLHFHAHDPAAWRDRLAFRLTRGAYGFRPDLAAFLSAATPAMIDDFYATVQTARPAALAALGTAGALIESDIGCAPA